MSAEDILIVGDAVQCADLRYATGLSFTGPCAYLGIRGRGYVIVPDVAVEHARECSTTHQVVAVGAVAEGSRGGRGAGDGALVSAIARLALAKRVRRLAVPAAFPLGTARALRKLKLRLKPCHGDWFFPGRSVKSAAELARIRASVVMAEVGLAEGVQALKTARLGSRGQLQYRGAPLTADRLRAVMQVAVLQAGGHADHSTVASVSGSTAEAGREGGVLRANQPIMLALSPRSEKTGYHASLARTVVRGRAGEPLRRLYAAAQRGHAEAFARLRLGVAAGDVYAAVEDCLAREGIRSRRQNGLAHGGPHEAGHGIGLDLREPPFLVAGNAATLEAGNVLVVGPVLHQPGLGGVHLQDLALITANGVRRLTQFETLIEL